MNIPTIRKKTSNCALKTTIETTATLHSGSFQYCFDIEPKQVQTI